MAQELKNTPAMQDTQEMQVRSLGQEDPLEEETAPSSSILAGEIPWMEEPVDTTGHMAQGVKTPVML